MARATDPAKLRIGFLGLGEVGQRFAADFRAADAARTLVAFDLLLQEAGTAEPLQRHAAAQRIEIATAAADLSAGCDLIFSAVTADQTLIAAQSLCRAGLAGALVVDLNSAAPATKIECARLIEAAGGRYVEAAVMTSVPPYGIRVPMLLGGPHATTTCDILNALGLVTQVAAEELGVASAIKLCRSVIIKGLESLVVESFTAARMLGVERQVLASLAETFPQLDWEKQGDYLFSRVIQHGKRRAEEMHASAVMIDATGVGGTMAGAASRRQAAVAALRAAGAFAEPAKLRPWRERADEIRNVTVVRPSTNIPPKC
jgi:3-hydroxyisobutyrate dehydrogenase-like beta-hydroxyacid dehydrogenase